MLSRAMCIQSPMVLFSFSFIFFGILDAGNLQLASQTHRSYSVLTIIYSKHDLTLLSIETILRAGLVE
jgi:hypothetical protein